MNRTLAFTFSVLLLGCHNGGVIVMQDSLGERPGGGPVVEKVLRVSPGQKLSLELDTGGTLAVSGWDREAVSVTARRGGADWRDVAVELREGPGGVLLTSRYTGGKQSHATSMSFEVQVPER